MTKGFRLPRLGVKTFGHLSSLGQLSIRYLSMFGPLSYTWTTVKTLGHLSKLFGHPLSWPASCRSFKKAAYLRWVCTPWRLLLYKTLFKTTLPSLKTVQNSDFRTFQTALQNAYSYLHFKCDFTSRHDNVLRSQIASQRTTAYWLELTNVLRNCKHVHSFHNFF